ncbi:hypothetical protein FA15DRAFT_723287 [Coprinopsis marcescibilis]|uniref:Uncharacterized protein n=1 Tax=Coprinopsis marcescibilis TaxID=230819 RepID=A0A5C3KHU8_COPMA|nr:hypothetical protein FA15DRAFT_723287 [Coprinopsis marcescibilis]
MFFRTCGYETIDLGPVDVPSPNKITTYAYGDLNGIDTVDCLHWTTGQRINLIQSLATDAVLPLLFFHSTTFMNHISHRGLTSLYPKLTLVASEARRRPRYYGIGQDVPAHIAEKWNAQSMAFIR